MIEKCPTMSRYKNISLLYDGLNKYHIELSRKRYTTTAGFMRWGKNNRYWAIETGDGYTFGDYATGLKDSIFIRANNNLSFQEIQQRKAAIQEAQAKAEQQRQKEQEDKVIEVTNLWQSLPNANQSHEYLTKKQVLSYGLKQLDDSLVVPLCDANGKMWSIQYIHPDGRKQFYTGGRTKGCFYVLGEIHDKVVFCEGYATGASVYQATTIPVAIAFNAGNLENVVIALKKKHPNLNIIIGADNDYKENAQTNVGRDVAMQIAEKYNNIKVIVPYMNENCKCDFNDIAVAKGLGEVRKQFSEGKSYDRRNK